MVPPLPAPLFSIKSIFVAVISTVPFAPTKNAPAFPVATFFLKVTVLSFPWVYQLLQEGCWNLCLMALSISPRTFLFFSPWKLHILPKSVSQWFILLLSSFSCISTTYSEFNLSPGQKQSFNNHSLVALLWWAKDERADKAKEGLGTQEQKNQTLIILPCPML